MLYFLLTLVNLYYLVTRILKVEKRAFHLLMFTLMQSTYFMIFASNSIKWALVDFVIAGTARDERTILLAVYWVVAYTSLMLNCFTHSIFVSKYWQIAQTQTNHCLSKFLYYGQFVLIVSCTITAITIKVLPIVRHQPFEKLPLGVSLFTSLPPLLIVILLCDALRRLAKEES